jgi:hypothetical protein
VTAVATPERRAATAPGGRELFRAMPEARLPLAPCMRWKVMNPPGHARWAWDLLGVDERGDPYFPRAALFVPRRRRAENFHGWAQPVCAPFDARVTHAQDGRRDEERPNFWVAAWRAYCKRPGWRGDFGELAGNHLVLAAGDGTAALLAHLRRGSLSVRVGQRVRAGDVLAQVGNSGASIVPHLHFQLLPEGELRPPLPALPARLTGLEAWDRRARGWRRSPPGAPQQGGVYRVACRGSDPALALRVAYLAELLARRNAPRAGLLRGLLEAACLAHARSVAQDAANAQCVAALMPLVSALRGQFAVERTLDDLETRLDWLATVACSSAAPGRSGDRAVHAERVRT